MELHHNACMSKSTTARTQAYKSDNNKVKRSISSGPALETTLSHKGSIFEEVLATVHGGANNIVNFGTNLIG